ncbi:hypothetical protein ACO0RG_003970 [Hanseniaspora osmophila]
MELHLLLTIFFILLTRVSNVYSIPENVVLYLLAPAEYKVELKNYQKILNEKTELKAEQSSISAQDQYAKWTKNNRRLEKMDKELSAKKTLIQSFKTVADQRTKYLKIALVTAPFFIVKFYYGKKLVYLFEEDHLSPMLPKPLQVVCTLGFVGVPMAIVKKVLSEILGKKTASTESAVLATSGVSLGIWIWALEKIISEIIFVYKNIFVKIDEPKTLNNPVEIVTKNPDVELIAPTSAELD